MVSAVRTWLLAQSSVTDLIGQRMYLDRLPQNATLPAVTVEKSSESHHHTLSNRSGFVETRLAFECHATLRLTANNVAQQIIDSGIAAVKGVTNSVDIRAVMIEDGQRNFTIDAADGSDDHQYVTTFDLMVSYLE